MANFAQQMGAISAETNAHRQDEALHKLRQIHDKVMKILQDEIKAKAAAGFTSMEWATGWISIQDLLGPEMSPPSVCELAARNFDKALFHMGFQEFKVNFKIDRKEESSKPPCFYAKFAFIVNWAKQEGQYVSNQEEQLRMQQHEQQMMREKQHRLQTYQEHPTHLPEFRSLVCWVNKMMTTTARGPGRVDGPWKADAFLDQMVAYMEHDRPSLKSSSLFPYDHTKDPLGSHSTRDPSRFLFGSRSAGTPIKPGEEGADVLGGIKNGYFIIPVDYKSAAKGYELLEFDTNPLGRKSSLTHDLSAMHNMAVNYTIGWWENRNRAARQPPRK